MAGSRQSGGDRSVEALLARLRALLDEWFPGEVISLQITRLEGGLALEGRIASESARSAAVRLLASFEGVGRITDRIEVTAFFSPASTDDERLFADADSIGRVAVEETLTQRQEEESIFRHPSIVCDTPLQPGRRIDIEVDLNVDAGANATDGVIAIAGLPHDWDVIDVTVQLSGPSLQNIESSKPSIALRADGTSTPATFKATIVGDAIDGTPVVVSAYFYYAARYCGAATKNLGVTNTPVDVSLNAAQGMVKISRATPPDLTVIIQSNGGGSLQWHWLSRSGVALSNGQSSARSDLGGGTADYAAGLLRSCPTIQQGDLQRRMQGIGEQLWEHAPPEFRGAYKELRNALGPDFPIQLILDDPHIPWEMMRPDIDGSKLLFLTHPIARWPGNHGNWLQSVLPRGSVRSFVPEYAENGTLPGARKERSWLVEYLDAIAVIPTKDEFLGLLECRTETAPVGIIHFAGHGRADTGDRDSGIRLQDNWVVLDEIRRQEVSLGKRDRSLVILNACEMAAESFQLGLVDGWAPALAGRQFGGVIAPLWRVQDEVACEVVLGALERLVMHKVSLGASLTQARALASDRSVAAFAFLAYGDVMAYIDRQ
jgi:hypothetical protein